MNCPTCKTQLSDDARFCSRCGAVFPATPLPPRPDRLDVPSGRGAWTEGKDLVIRQNTGELPASCIRCGQPAQSRIKAKLYWHSPWAYLTILVNIIVYAIVAMIVRKNITVEVPLCEVHRKQRTRFQWLAAGAGVGSFVVLFALLAYDQAGVAVTAFFALLLAAIVLGFKSRLLVPRYIDAEIAKVRGPCEAFMSQLPRRAA